MSRVSLKDIAKKAGVSGSTVSLVLNGKDKDGRISKDVAERVREIAIELNYRPNMSARSLRTGVTKTLGLIVADISNPFFAKMARCIENIAAQKGYQVMFGSSDESKVKFQNLINLFIEKNVDGIILAPPEDSDSAIMQLIRRKMPVVLIDRGIDGLPVSSVQIDNAGAAFVLTNMLIEKGCKRIGFMAYNINLPNIKRRYEGYVNSLKANDIPIDPNLVRSVTFEDFERQIGENIDYLLKQRVDSMVFATNRVGVQSLLALQKYDKLPSLEYVSIDNSDEYKVSKIPISCIEQPIEGLSNRALSILFRHIENPNYDEVESVVLQVKIDTPDNRQE